MSEKSTHTKKSLKIGIIIVLIIFVLFTALTAVLYLSNPNKNNTKEDNKILPSNTGDIQKTGKNL